MSAAPDQMFLTDDEVKALTKRVHYVSQVKVLCQMGIDHKIRPDGSVVVLRQHIKEVMGMPSDKKPRKVVEPNWGALGAARA